jgi:hypothetical protein
MPRARNAAAAPEPEAPALDVEAPFDPSSFPFDDEELLLAIQTKRLPGTESAAVVRTESYVDALRAVSHAATRRQLVCFYGDPGSGKSLSALSACQALTIRPFYVGIAPSKSGKDVEAEIWSKIDPEEFVPSASRFTMRRGIVKRLAERPCVLVIDEFDLTKGEGLDVLRFLLEQRRAKAGFVVVGSEADRLLATCRPLYSRCARWVSFGTPARASLLPYLRAYHPLLAATPDEALLRIDREWAHGNLREWAKFLEAALRVGASPDRGLSDPEIGLSYRAINRPSDRGGR